VVDVVDHAGREPVDADERHPAGHPVVAEQLGQSVLVPQPVLDRQDRAVVLQQRADERLVRRVPGRLEADEHEVGLRGLASVPVDVQRVRRQVEVAVGVAADVQPVQPDGVVVGPEQQVDVVAGADQLRAVVPADGANADDGDHGAGVGRKAQGTVLTRSWGRGSVWWSVQSYG
jgi:hypothetical protein